MKRTLLVVIGLTVAIVSTTTTASDTSVILTKDTADLANSKQELPDLVIESMSLGISNASYTMVVRNVGFASTSVNTTVKGVVSRTNGNYYSKRTKRTFTFALPVLAAGEAVSLTGSTSTRSSPPRRPIASSSDPGGSTQGDPEHDVPIEYPDSISVRSSPPRQPIASPSDPGGSTQGDPEHDVPIEYPADPNDVISIKAYVDNGKQIDESDETNNAITRKFRIVQ